MAAKLHVRDFRYLPHCILKFLSHFYIASCSFLIFIVISAAATAGIKGVFFFYVGYSFYYIHTYTYILTSFECLMTSTTKSWRWIINIFSTMTLCKEVSAKWAQSPFVHYFYYYYYAFPLSLVIYMRRQQFVLIEFLNIYCYRSQDERTQSIILNDILS